MKPTNLSCWNRYNLSQWLFKRERKGEEWHHCEDSEQEGRQPLELTSILQGVCLGSLENACSLKIEGEKL